MTGRKKERKPLGPWKQSHPTVSFRVALEDRKRLDDIVDREGKSLSELLHIGLGLVQREVVNGRTKYSQGRAEGMRSGIDEGRRLGFAEGLGKFDLRCSRCGKPLRFDSKVPEQRAVLERAFATWYHGGNGCSH